MKQVSKYILVASLFVFMVSCLAPTSKEAYLEKFESFVDRVEQNHKKYTEKDWEWANSKFEKYDGEWYSKFRGEFTLSDQIKIKSLIIRYNSYKSKDGVSDVLKQLFKKDVDDVYEKVTKYIEKDLDDDLDKMIEGATAIGDSAVKVLEEVVRELDETF